jgi:hypothetical protein
MWSSVERSEKTVTTRKSAETFGLVQLKFHSSAAFSTRHPERDFIVMVKYRSCFI